jgi:hypothetical protein
MFIQERYKILYNNAKTKSSMRCWFLSYRSWSQSSSRRSNPQVSLQSLKCSKVASTEYILISIFYPSLDEISKRSLDIPKVFNHNWSEKSPFPFDNPNSFFPRKLIAISDHGLSSINPVKCRINLSNWQQWMLERLKKMKNKGLTLWTHKLDS